jgi:uncharacterized membrane protein required for colicin V production
MAKKTKKIKIQTSKLLTYIVTGLFCFCVIYALMLTIITRIPVDNIDRAIDVLKTVATSFSVIITGYFTKSGVENWKKIGYSENPNTSSSSEPTI